MKHSNLWLLGLAFSLSARAQKFNPPTMGWSSWNTFALDISDDLIRSQADAMVATGLKDAGYRFINIDDGYWNGRAEDGQLRLNTERFPNGMRSLVDYIHAKGLKAGIYSDAGDNTCGSGNRQAWGLGVGLAGHETEDCRLYFDEWDFDFIKVDYCGGIHMRLNEWAQYSKIRDAIKACKKKDVVFNVCRWAYPGTWISEVSDSWRTTGDIYCAWKSVRDIIRENLYLQAYTGRGHYNDPDMLEIGRTLTPDEENTHMAYWCITSAPLLIGCDMRNIPRHSLELMKNADLIAMNQDCLGLGAPVVQREGDVFVFAKDMKQVFGKQRAVVVSNLSDEPRTIRLDLQALGFADKVLFYDCLTHSQRGTFTESMTVNVPAHGSAAFFATGRRAEQTLYQAEEAWLKCYQELRNEETARYSDAPQADQGAYVSFLGNRPDNYLEWQRVYSAKGGTYELHIRYASGEDRAMEVSVNGAQQTLLTNLYTGSYTDRWQEAIVKVQLKKGNNVVRIANPAAFAPNIDCMTLKKL